MPVMWGGLDRDARACDSQTVLKTGRAERLAVEGADSSAPERQRDDE